MKVFTQRDSCCYRFKELQIKVKTKTACPSMQVTRGKLSMSNEATTSPRVMLQCSLEKQGASEKYCSCNLIYVPCNFCAKCACASQLELICLPIGCWIEVKHGPDVSILSHPAILPFCLSAMDKEGCLEDYCHTCLLPHQGCNLQACIKS